MNRFPGGFAMQTGPGSNPFITPTNNVNVIHGQNGFDSADRATHPAKKVVAPRFTLILDSRQRDCRRFPKPCRFTIPLGDVFKNITSIELKGIILPKTSYNVHSTNNKIDFAIGDGVTRINVTKGGSGYTSAPDVTLSSPSGAGTTATATAVIDSFSKVVAVNIVLAGSGYSSSTPPIVVIDPPPPSGSAIQAQAVSTVGTHYTAELRDGQYSIGGNPIPGTTTVPTGLLLEIQDAMNFAVNGSPYVPESTSPFAVRVVNQYPELDAVAGSPEAFNTNATQFNRIQITNVNSDPWELLFCTGNSKSESAHGVLGFELENKTSPTVTAPVLSSGGTLIPGGTTYRAQFDYNLTDDPSFVVMRFWAGDDQFERIRSVDDGMNRKFASLVFDANLSNALKDLNANTSGGGSVETVGDSTYLIGPTGKGTFWGPQGTLKALKGFDFDQKRLTFSPGLGKLTSLSVMFSKYGLNPGGVPQFYDFQGREITLILEVTAGDQQSFQKE